VIRHEKKKPAVLHDVMHHFTCREEHQVAIIGDRILSDIVMGNKHGFFTIHVQPFDTKVENVVVKMVRAFEDKYLKYLLPGDGQGAPPHHTISHKE